jgi:hypothetical protein
VKKEKDYHVQYPGNPFLEVNMTQLVFFVFLAVVALQFSDALGQYAILKNSMADASEWLQKAVAKFGLAPTLITTKVVIVAVVTALYFLTSLPLWLWLAAAAYFLYRTGKWTVIWALIKKNA